MKTHLVSAFVFASVTFGALGCMDPMAVDAATESVVSDLDSPKTHAQNVAGGSSPIHYIGTDGNWFDGRNWDSGVVPGPNDDVLLDGNAVVVIDPANDSSSSATGSGSVLVHDIVLAGNAAFETLPGTRLQFNVFSAYDDTSFFARSSEWSGGTVFLTPYDCPTWKCGFNPSAIQADSVQLETENLAFYIGGNLPAARGATGPGHYATVRGSTVYLTASDLAVDFKYGFVPCLGDQFVIVEASDRLVGTFANFADGDEVVRIAGVKLVISYQTNRIVLNTQTF